MLGLILAACLTLQVLSVRVRQVNHDIIDEVFEHGYPALILLYDDSVHSFEARVAFSQFALTNPAVLLAETDKHDKRTSMKSTDDNFEDPDNFNFFKRITQFLGINKDDLPNILYISYPEGKYQYHIDTVTLEGIKDFLELAQSASIRPHYKSQPIPTEPDFSIVKKVVGLNFKQLVLEDPRQTIVMFYAPWCGLCHRVEKYFLSAAQRLRINPNIAFKDIDATGNEVEGTKIERFPTIYYWTKDKTAPPIKLGSIPDSDNSLVSWIQQVTQYEWVPEQTDSFGEDL